MLCQLINSALLLAFISYQIVVADNHMTIKFLAQLQYISYCFLELFVYCHRGEEMFNEV